jgi:hypothetical protein
VTDPALPTPAPTTAASGPPTPLPALRLLSSADDVACVDDLCLPAGARPHLGAPGDAMPPDDATPLDVADPAR